MYMKCFEDMMKMEVTLWIGKCTFNALAKRFFVLLLLFGDFLLNWKRYVVSLMHCFAVQYSISILNTPILYIVLSFVLC